MDLHEEYKKQRGRDEALCVDCESCRVNTEKVWCEKEPTKSICFITYVCKDFTDKGDTERIGNKDW